MTVLDNNLDLTSCDKEPIRIPGAIQPHGCLVVIRPSDFTLLQVTQNISEISGHPASDLLGQPLSALIGRGQSDSIRQAIPTHDLSAGAVYLHTMTMTGGRSYHVSAHQNPAGILIEFERAESDAELSFQNLYPLVREFISRLGSVPTLRQLCDLAAKEIRRITGFDRVLVYQFDENWNGQVVGEDRDPDAYAPFMGLWFPASDIPKQARELYRLTRVRQIVDAAYTPVPVVPSINPETRATLDMTYASLRSVSPIHCEYLKNMEVAGSFSIAIQTAGEKLWGIVSCHHRTPRQVPLEVRTACDLLGQTIGLQVQARESQGDAQHRIALKEIQGKLLAYMTMAENFVDGLVQHPAEFLDLVGAQGAAILFENQVRLVGQTPTEDQIRELAEWLGQTTSQDIFSTHHLAGENPQFESIAAAAAGLLAVSISKLHRSYVIWFRPEVVQTVEWGGDPHKAAAVEGMRIHPRKSFAAWKETVHLRSTPWRPSEIETAAELRNGIVGIVLRRAEIMASLTAELERSNKELEAFSYSVSHDLRAPFRHIVGYSELLREREQDKLSPDGRRYINTIIESAQFAGTLVDNLLMFSQIGRSSLHPIDVNTGTLLREIVNDMRPDAKGRNIEWRVTGSFPILQADPTMLRLAFQNLIENAIKYTRDRDPALIEIAYREEPTEHIFSVRDNGVGFDMQYAEKLFGVFQRLHRMEDYEGTGIGLANVRRAITRHGGRTWAEGVVDQGATFYIAIPKPTEPENS
ncbi:MAG TPA: ATP-binding protein [Tepidisphaeraceae bacterium]|nr:ATP-binding protein [Tepidisphaeraceae bacterium]